MNPPATSATVPPALAPVTSQAPSWKIAPSADGNFVNSVAVSADGSRVVAGTFYNVYPKAEQPRRRGVRTTPTQQGTFGTYCYDGSGTLLWSSTYTGWEGVYWVALSADGKRAAAGGTIAKDAPQGILQAFDATTGTQLLNVTTESRVNQVALSADGAWLVSAADTLRLFQYVASVGAYVQKAEFVPSNSGRPSTDQNGVVSAGISADGTVIALADYYGHVVVCTNSDGTLTTAASWQVPGGQDSDFCHMIDLAPDGKNFAAGGANGNFYLFDVAEFTASQLPTLTYATGVAGAVYGVAVEGDGSGFAGVVNLNDAGAVYFVQRNLAGAMLQCTFPTTRNPNSVALNVGAKLMAVADGHPDGTPGNFYLYDGIAKQLLPPAEKAQLLWTCPTGNMSWPIVISANASAVVGGSDDGCVYYFKV